MCKNRRLQTNMPKCSVHFAFAPSFGVHNFPVKIAFGDIVNTIIYIPKLWRPKHPYLLATSVRPRTLPSFPLFLLSFAVPLAFASGRFEWKSASCLESAHLFLAHSIVLLFTCIRCAIVHGCGFRGAFFRSVRPGTFALRAICASLVFFFMSSGSRAFYVH